MKIRTYKILGTLTTMAMGAVIGWSVAKANFLIVLIAIAVGMLLLYLLKKNVDEVMEDEMVYKIAEKASRAVFQVFILAAAAASVVLISMRESYPYYGQVGFTLAFSVCALLLLYLVFYGHYKKHLK